ncbi:DUF3592 domain-containing protein [Burkholderia sp. BKH01]|uniref:DUF3592 domain-containing protein n=1 Tax=Burkholderia sp. BKH01 TaxID=2769262 RepID=UPI0021DF85FF|nr:DUF3592 domain-containing protein [Burkholderia sp. BKH01]MCU9954114.1 DUF3592 domain-containing protein [Burkholderia sp. BKH01]
MTGKAGRFNYVALAIGVAMAVWSAASINERFAFVRTSVAVQGTVVQLNYGAHHPEIAFVTQSGEHVSFPASFVTVAVGDAVPVRYDPARPSATAKVDTFMNNWLESILSVAFAIAFMYAGLTGESFRPRYGARRN